MTLSITVKQISITEHYDMNVPPIVVRPNVVAPKKVLDNADETKGE
jgi:hypothetical protein